MANTLVHQVVESRKAGSLLDLRTALEQLGRDYPTAEIDRAYRVEVVAEHLSDGFVCHELRIRPLFGAVEA